MNCRMQTLFASAALMACTALPVTAAAAPDKTLTINVYQVCDNAGANCADTGVSAGDTFFSAATNKIWAQAGISVGYNFAGQLNNTSWLTIDDNTEFNAITAAGGHFQSTSVVDMFLVHTILPAITYGQGWLGVGGLVMAMDSILGYAPGGRIDTMAHELGHNFGLVDPSDPTFSGYHSTNPNQLMAAGSIRNVPLTLADISPDGLGYDQLSPLQINIARQSSLLSDIEVSAVPEPQSYALWLAGLGVMGFLARRGRRCQV